ncbi:MAG: endonuclease/exonuclease/phosphatase family protein [Flavobacteriaceae bacterium]|nr:endonuclease/exonuclease/phosphatase family protein [Flavobacteriaceae bacterium]
MKNLGLLDKIIFVLNSLLAFGLLISYLLPYVPPKTFPLLSVLSLGVPLLIISNLLFLVFWAIRFKRQLLLSLIVLLIGYNHVFSLFQFSGNTEEISAESLSVMSYNVRMFNSYNWSKDKKIPEKMTDFVTEKNPDILLTQEHYIGDGKMFRDFPYNFVFSKDKNSEFGSAIFSKYPIIKKHSVGFPEDGNNNAIFVDIVKDKDTLRIFNVHFQSLNIKPEIKDLQEGNSRKLIGRIGYGFKLQQNQAEMLMKEVERSPYKTLIIGDFNNTAFSYIYQLVKGIRFNDAFLEAGTGFGKSFNLSYFPLRIDFFMIDKSIEIESFEVIPVEYSDHFPLLTRIKW